VIVVLSELSNCSALPLQERATFQWDEGWWGFCSTRPTRIVGF